MKWTLLILGVLCCGAVLRSPKDIPRRVEVSQPNTEADALRVGLLVPKSKDPAKRVRRIVLSPPLPMAFSVPVSATTISVDSRAAVLPPQPETNVITFQHPNEWATNCTFTLWGTNDVGRVRQTALTNLPGTARSVKWITTGPSFFFTLSAKLK